MADGDPLDSNDQAHGKPDDTTEEIIGELERHNSEKCNPLESTGTSINVAETGNRVAGDNSAVLEIDSDVEEVELQPQFEINVDDELRDEEGADKDDSQLLSKEKIPYPPLYPCEKEELSGARSKVVAKIEQEAEKAMEAGNVPKAIEKYTEAMRTGGASALMLANRGGLLLKQKRPCAAIRDCTAALKINPHIMKAYRLRGIAHRMLGHWQRAQRDLSEAQSLFFDSGTADIQKFVAEKINGKADPSSNQKSVPIEVHTINDSVVQDSDTASASIPEKPPPQPSSTKDLFQGQAVQIFGLQRAPHLNGKRGVVQRADPRPAQRGRWEIELRLDNGKLEVKTIKAENIHVLNKADKRACREWTREEKRHMEERRKLEEQEEQSLKVKAAQRRLEASLASLPIEDDVRAMFRQLDPLQALALIEKSSDKSSTVTVNDYFLSALRQQLNIVGSDDEVDEEDPEDEDDSDPELLEEDTDMMPPAPVTAAAELTDEQLEAINHAKEEAVAALEEKDVDKALQKYSEAIQIGGGTALLLAKRAELLLQQRRPRAAIQDSAAAINMNPDCGMAYRIRGIAYRRLGQWEEANRDITQAQKVDFDENTAVVHNFVALRLNALQERGPSNKRKANQGGQGRMKQAKPM